MTGANVTCKNCGIVLDVDSGEIPENRTPCPVCGSTSRDFYLYAGGGVYKMTGNPVEFIVYRNSFTSLLLQTVVLSGEKTDEGQIIEAVSLPWLEIVKYFEKYPTAIYQISDRKLEEIIAGAYKRAGFDEVILTPRSGDFGRDVIAIKRGLGTIRVIDQAKAYKPGHLVTANDVRALAGVLHCDGASKGFITTTSDFAPRIKTDPLIKPLMPSRLELINGEALVKRLIELGKELR
jgi:restriction system protein